MRRPRSTLAKFAATFVGGALAIALVAGVTIGVAAQTPKAQSFKPLSKLSLPELPQGSTLYDMNGDKMGRLTGAENREIVALSQISPEMQKTVLAVEDRDFYNHNGVSARSVARALKANTEAGGVSQGGSTITQQLVKLTMVGNERSISRKLKEASLAVQLERQFCQGATKKECKDRIFEQYLNTIYLGRGAYGVQAAARTYFGVDAKDLTWGQSATLAALIRNPTGYDPIRFPEVAEERRRIVMSVLVGQKLLRQNQAELYQEVPLPTEVKERSVVTSAADLSYFERKVRDELLRSSWLASTPELRKYLVFNGGLKVTTTYDPRAQELAEAAARTNPLKAANPETQAVVASVEPATGAVRAVVGEVSTPKGAIVEVADSKVGRSPGSSFKTFTFAAAMEEGYSVNDVISASPAPARLYPGWGVEGPSWPAECNGGTLPLITALAKSNNCAFVRLQQAVGSAKVVDVARRLGITTIQSPRDEVPSLSLGGVSVRPLEMAAAYAAIANDGKANPAHFIDKVVDGKGKVIYQYSPPNTQAISVQSARETTAALQQVVRAGTYGAGALPSGRQAGGKTGTNEQDSGANTDVWFVGFTPEMSTAVWIGNPARVTNMRGGKVQGGSTSAKVWRAFMAPYLEGRPVAKFPAAAANKGKGTVKDPWGGETAPVLGSTVPGRTTKKPTGSTGTKSTATTVAKSPGTTAGSGGGTGGGAGGGTGSGGGAGSDGGTGTGTP